MDEEKEISSDAAEETGGLARRTFLKGLGLGLMFVTAGRAQQPFNSRQKASAGSPTNSRDKCVFEMTFESKKVYSDPFNDVDVDIIFHKDERSWRVPTFWRGGNKWGVRFAPPSPGKYTYYLESTDKNNIDLNGHKSQVTIAPYKGVNALLKHGPLRVSSNKRYLEHTDGTPFYWLGETLYTCLSDRISWNGFQKLISDRKAKGFTVAELCVGLTCSNEELAPVDPGFGNEGGAVWDPEFKRINPGYFDYADRRVQYVIDNEMTPALIGAWHQALQQMGMAKMKKHWRYIIARYGAYPVLWILGGEIYDPPEARLLKYKLFPPTRGWTEVAQYLRAIDPYHRLLTAHQSPLPYDIPLQDESLTDFELFQPSHFGWPSAALEVAQLNTHWARTDIRKPLVVGEIGWEKIGATHFEDFQRAAFWLAMLNGAAGFSYGSTETSEAYSTDKKFHRIKYSFRTWEEGMNFPGAYQTGIGAKLLRQYPWWRFEPHPEWVTPRGTTLLEPRNGEPDLGTWLSIFTGSNSNLPKTLDFPGGEWKKKDGNIFLPYASGIPGDVRIIYLPYFGFVNLRTDPPTILGLELGVLYHAYYWEPSLGIKIDLGAVENPSPGALIQEDKFESDKKLAWIEHGTKRARINGRLSVSGQSISVLRNFSERDYVVAVGARSDAEAGLVLRYRDDGNYLAAVYSSKEKAIYLVNRKNGVDGGLLGRTTILTIGPDIRLAAEVRNDMATLSITDGQRTYAAPIVSVGRAGPGSIGLLLRDNEAIQSFDNFELRKSPTLVKDNHLERKLYDASGLYRGELVGPGFADDPKYSGWDDFGKNKNILLGAYRPERLPFPGDWVLVLENRRR